MVETTATTYKTRVGILIAIGGTISLILFLYFFTDHTPPVQTRFDDLIEESYSSMAEADVDEMRSLARKSQKGNAEAKATALKQLAAKWEAQEQVGIAAEFYRQAADLQPNAEDFGKAGDHFFDSFKAETDPDARVDYVYRAIYSLEKSVEMDSTDLSRKLKLADCYTEGTGNMMMQGVFLLRDISKDHPEDAGADLRLARFSMMSGQIDKAVLRAKSVLEKDSLNLQARYLLAESYMSMGLKDSTISVLEEGLGLFSDSTTVADLKNGLEQLRAE